MVLGFGMWTALGLSGCDKASEQGGTIEPPSAAKPVVGVIEKEAAPAPRQPSLVDHAERFGFAAHLPKSTQFYVGSLQLKRHLADLEKTAWWKDLATFVQDRTPAPSAKGAAGSLEESLKQAGKFWGDDFFVALGAGSPDALKALMRASELYTEVSYRGMMEGGALASLGGSFDPQSMVTALLSDPKILDQLSDLADTLIVPPVMAGVRVEKPADLLESLFPGGKPPASWTAGKRTEMELPGGAKLITYDFKVGDLVTEKDRRKILDDLDKVQEGKGGDLRTKREKVMTALMARRFMLSWGQMGGYVLFAAGPDGSHLQLATSPAESLLARPELQSLMPHVNRNLAALVFADGELLAASSAEEPMQPMLRGLLAGLKSSEMFADLAGKLESKLPTLAATERAFYKRTFKSLAGVAWWDGGLQWESTGGGNLRGIDSSAPLRFSPLMDQAGVLYSLISRTEPQVARNGRAYFEQWTDLLHTAAQELVKSGLGGEQAGQVLSMIDQTVLPGMVDFYKGSRTIYQDALGPESAFVVDLGGKMPALPGIAAQGDRPLLRVAGVHEVKDREKVASSWKQMEGALTKMLSASPVPYQLPSALSSDKNGVTTWFYPIPFASDDLLPCASISDRLFLFGSSKSFNETLAARISASSPAAPEVRGLVWRLSFARIRELAKAAAGFVPAEETGEGIKSAIRWLAPLEDMRGHCWEDEAGLRHDQFSWSMHDVLKYD